MQVIAIILAIVLALFLVYVAFKHYTTKKRIVNAFKVGSVCVSGRKRYGKDILFSSVIKARKEEYFANIDYGYGYNHIEMKDLLLGDNDYKSFIDGKVEVCQKIDKLEGKDIYISDGGVYLPSQMDSYLHKIYPSFPITYALSGHMYNNGIHVNTQRLDRLWKALREQSDYFIRMRKRCLKLPFFFVLFTTEYDKYESAVQELSPMKSTLFNKYSKAEKELYRAQHGFIKDGFYLVSKHSLKYDTRAFHKVIFGEEAPRKETLWTKLRKNLLKSWTKITKSLAHLSKNKERTK